MAAKKNHFKLSEEDIRIIEKRREEMRSGKVKGIPHAEAMAALKAKFKKVNSI